MGRRRAAALSHPALIAVAGLCLAAGCHQRAFVVTGMDAAATDGSPDAQTTLTLDISVTGCANLSVGGATAVSCSGPVPLTVSFAPVGSAALTTFRWMFGDRSPSSMDPAPTHTYTLPGSYTVMVTGEGTVGTVSRVRENLISVLALAAGASCDVDSQCGQGLRCLCQPGAGCPAAFTRGICTTACATGFCGAGAVCADYPLPAAAGGADGGDDAAAGAGLTATCLADCSSTSCPSGFVCQSLPAAGQGSAGWVEACLPLGAAHDLGASCRGADGALHDAACSTGLCANLGDLGMCSAPCDGAHPCPAGSGCARLAGLPAPVCLPSCSASAPCAPDPAIGCAAAITADAGTDGGVPIISGALDASYCAPF